jgi:hypothetical protein
MGSYPDSELKRLYERDPEQARVYLRHLLHINGGFTTRTARYINCSKKFVQNWLERLGMETEPTAIRKAWRARYRL